MSDLISDRDDRIERFFARRDGVKNGVQWKRILKIVGKVAKWTILISLLVVYEIFALFVAFAILVLALSPSGLLLLYLPFSIKDQREKQSYEKLKRQYINSQIRRVELQREKEEDQIDYDEFWNNWDYFDNTAV